MIGLIEVGRGESEIGRRELRVGGRQLMIGASASGGRSLRTCATSTGSSQRGVGVVVHFRWTVGLTPCALEDSR